VFTPNQEVAVVDEVIRDYLIGIAQAGTDPATYTDVGALRGLDMSVDEDRDALSAILDEISRTEHQAGRPLLSALVVHGSRGKPSGFPGEGFFKMARQVGRYHGRGYLEDAAFYVDEVTSLFAYWRTQSLP
jgi:hypothetical protein